MVRRQIRTIASHSKSAAATLLWARRDMTMSSSSRGPTAVMSAVDSGVTLLDSEDTSRRTFLVPSWPPVRCISSSSSSPLGGTSSDTKGMILDGTMDIGVYADLPTFELFAQSGAQERLEYLLQRRVHQVSSVAAAHFVFAISGGSASTNGNASGRASPYGMAMDSLGTSSYGTAGSGSGTQFTSGTNSTSGSGPNLYNTWFTQLLSAFPYLENVFDGVLGGSGSRRASILQRCGVTGVGPSNGAYHLRIENGQTVVVGADRVGFAYVLRMLCQLIDQSVSRVPGQLPVGHGSHRICFPRMCVTESASIDTRAVTWSLRYNVWARRESLDREVRFLSCARINCVFLMLDGLGGDDISALSTPSVSNDVGSDSKMNLAKSGNDVDDRSADLEVTDMLLELKRICMKHSIVVVPVVEIDDAGEDSQWKDSLPLACRYFDGLLVVCVPSMYASTPPPPPPFYMDSPPPPPPPMRTLSCNSEDGENDLNSTNALWNHIQGCVFNSRINHLLVTRRPSLPPTSKSTSSGPWDRSPSQMSIYAAVAAGEAAAAAADSIPPMLHTAGGVCVVEELDHEIFFPSTLQQKPIIMVRAFIESIIECVAPLSASSAYSTAIFPMHREHDFLCPSFLVKYLLLIFGAATYQGEEMRRFFQANHGLDRKTNELLLRIVSETNPRDEARFKRSADLRKGLVSLIDWSNHHELGRSASECMTIELAMWSLCMSNEAVLPPQKLPSSLKRTINGNSVSALDDVTISGLCSPDHAIKVYRLYRTFFGGIHHTSTNFKLNLLRARSSPEHPSNLCSICDCAISSCRCQSGHGWFSLGVPANSGRFAGLDELMMSINMLSLSSRTIYLSTTLASTGSMEIADAVLGDVQSPQQKRAAIYDNLDLSKPYAPTVHPKTDAISQMLREVVQFNILFRNFKTEEHIRIVEAFESVQSDAGDVIIQQGDSGEYFYIVECGELEVYMESGAGSRIKVGRTLSAGDYFGELALMYNTPRAATVISTTRTVLWRISRQTYRTIVTYHNKVTFDEFYSLVCNVHILGKRLGDVLSVVELSKVVASLEVEEFEHDSVIIRQRQTGDYFYIISEGQVDVYQEKEPREVSVRGGTTGHKYSNPCMSGGVSTGLSSTTGLLGEKIATLGRGDYFGEKALLADDVRQASCVAVGRVVCLSLSREDFIAMIGSWQDITAVGGNDVRSIHSKTSNRRNSVYDSQYHLSIDLEELEKLNVLGLGAFGRVQVARHKESGQLYALKCQAKSLIVNQGMQTMVMNEIRIIRRLDHPLICKLHAAVEDKRTIYLLFELLPGGEFFSFLQKNSHLSESNCRFYAASVVLALEELHKHRIAYRDLKPENMVMDARGFVKLVDFGLAKQVMGSTWTVCGTPDYLAPEIILNKGHNHAVDYWALGVLLYEMAHGFPPFYHEQPMKVYEKIIMNKVNFPQTFSKPLEDLITKLLVTNPSKRLGNMKGAIAEIVKHKWFGSFDWQGLLAGTMDSPYVPDLSAFDAAVAAAAMELEEDHEDDYFLSLEESDWNLDL